MKETKRKILDKALDLFNKNGTANVTVRHIAAALNMSHGNLCYHFPTTEDIILKLYEELSKSLDEAMKGASENLASKDIKLAYIFKGTEESFAIFYKYRFLFLDLVSIMRRIEMIRLKYKELQEVRKIQFKMIFSLLGSKGYMGNEKISGDFDRLIELVMLTGDYWISCAEILHKDEEVAKIRHYSQIFNQLLVPYFTMKGIKEYKAYYKC